MKSHNKLLIVCLTWLGLMLALLTLGSIPARADELKLPKRADTHKFYDRPAKLELAIWAGVGVGDLTQTCRFMARGIREVWMPGQGCRTMVGLGVASVAGVELTGWLLHKTGHHRLERLPRLLGIAGNSAGLIVSKRRGDW